MNRAIEQEGMHERIMYRLLAVVMFLTISISGCSGKAIKLSQDLSISREFERSFHIPLSATTQINQYTCGIASLVSSFKYWGIDDINQEKILAKYPPNSRADGYSLNELKAIAKEYGLNAFSIPLSYEKLLQQLQLGRTLIVRIIKPAQTLLFGSFYFGPQFNSWKRTTDHFVVLAGYNRERVIFMDPVDGFVAIKKEDFIKSWDPKVALLISR